jgi:hypothetical protein
LDRLAIPNIQLDHKPSFLRTRNATGHDTGAKPPPAIVRID